VQDVTPRKSNPAPADRRRLRLLVEARHVRRRIARPALTPNVLSEPRIAVGKNVQTRDLLLVQIHRQRILVLLAKLRLDHRLDERPQP